MDEQLRADLARAMGMKVREVVAYEPVDGGYLVTTHDGQKTPVEMVAPKPVAKTSAKA